MDSKNANPPESTEVPDPKADRRTFSPGFLIIVLCLVGSALAVRHFATGLGGIGAGILQPCCIGKPAPQLDLIELPTHQQLITADVQLADRVTLLHFWGTWCGPCRMEYPELVEAASELSADPKFQFVSVSCEGYPSDTLDNLWEQTQSFFDSEGIESTAFADPRGVTRQSMAQRIGQEHLYFPTSVLIGPDKTIHGIWEGYCPMGVGEIVTKTRSLSKASESEF